MMILNALTMVMTMTRPKSYPFEMQDQREFADHFGLDVKDIKIEQIRSPFFDKCHRQWTIPLNDLIKDLPPCPWCKGNDLYLQIAWMTKAYKQMQAVHFEFRFWVQCADMGCWTQGPFRTTAIRAVTDWAER